MATVLKPYNKLAITMDPLKPELSWDNITSLDFISDIVLLWGHDDVCQKQWAKPLFHTTTQAWCKLQWACEEIHTIHLEACWVWASIKNEVSSLSRTIEKLHLTDPKLAEYIAINLQYCLNVNAHLKDKLAQLNKRAHFLSDDEIPVASGPLASPGTCDGPDNSISLDGKCL